MRHSFGRVCGWLIVATAVPAYAQAPENSASGAVGAQGPGTTVATVRGGPLTDGTRSLFAPGWNLLELSGRVSSVSGDPARWQRYEDLRDGLLFTGARVHRSATDWI